MLLFAISRPRRFAWAGGFRVSWFLRVIVSHADPVMNFFPSLRTSTFRFVCSQFPRFAANPCFCHCTVLVAFITVYGRPE